MSEKSTFGGFDALGEILSNPDNDFVNVLPDDDNDPGTDKIVDNPGGEEEIKDPSSLNNEKDVDKNNDVDPEENKDGITKEIEDDKIETNSLDNSNLGENNNEEVDLGDYEEDVANYVQEKIYEKLGWNSEEDKSFKSIDEIVDFLNNVVEENSKPEFANEELANLNEFVINGGNIESYLQQRYDGNVNLDKVDITESANQNLILREYFKEQGYNSANIEKRLQRYEDTGIKEEEAREAYDLLKNIREEKSNKLLETQRKNRDLLVKQQQDFYKNVSSSIDEIKDIRGIPVSTAEKNKLTEYIFRPMSDGKTAYQKEYESSVKNLIESAFFTMKGDTLINKMNNKATSNAAKTLKERLETKTKRGRNTNVEDDIETKGSNFSLFRNIGSSLHKPQF